MSSELIICIPGPWIDRNDFFRRVITLDPPGSYMFAGELLVHPSANNHVEIEFCPPDERMADAFRVAGQGKISDITLDRIASHTGVAYLHFPIDIRDQRERILKYTQVLQRLGGFAVKLESSGIAHEWNRWFSLLSGSPFNVYCSAAILVAGDDIYYSCGMHHFLLPECAVPHTLSLAEAVGLLNQFNFWRIVEEPYIESGHTFGINADAPRYRMHHKPDTNHDPEDLFHNSHGVWHLVDAEE